MYLNPFHFPQANTPVQNVAVMPTPTSINSIGYQPVIGPTSMGALPMSGVSATTAFGNNPVNPPIAGAGYATPVHRAEPARRVVAPAGPIYRTPPPYMPPIGGAHQHSYTTSGMYGTPSVVNDGPINSRGQHVYSGTAASTPSGAYSYYPYQSTPNLPSVVSPEGVHPGWRYSLPGAGRVYPSQHISVPQPPPPPIPFYSREPDQNLYKAYTTPHVATNNVLGVANCPSTFSSAPHVATNNYLGVANCSSTFSSAPHVATNNFLGVPNCPSAFSSTPHAATHDVLGVANCQSTLSIPSVGVPVPVPSGGIQNPANSTQAHAWLDPHRPVPHTAYSAAYYQAANAPQTVALTSQHEGQHGSSNYATAPQSASMYTQPIQQFNAQSQNAGPQNRVNIQNIPWLSTPQTQCDGPPPTHTRWLSTPQVQHGPPPPHTRWLPTPHAQNGPPLPQAISFRGYIPNELPVMPVLSCIGVQTTEGSAAAFPPSPPPPTRSAYPPPLQQSAYQSLLQHSTHQVPPTPTAPAHSGIGDTQGGYLSTPPTLGMRTRVFTCYTRL